MTRCSEPGQEAAERSSVLWLQKVNGPMNSPRTTQAYAHLPFLRRLADWLSRIPSAILSTLWFWSPLAVRTCGLGPRYIIRDWNSTRLFLPPPPPLPLPPPPPLPPPSVFWPPRDGSFTVRSFLRRHWRHSNFIFFQFSFAFEWIIFFDKANTFTCSSSKEQKWRKWILECVIQRNIQKNTTDKNTTLKIVKFGGFEKIKYHASSERIAREALQRSRSPGNWRERSGRIHRCQGSLHHHPICS